MLISTTRFSCSRRPYQPCFGARAQGRPLRESVAARDPAVLSQGVCACGPCAADCQGVYGHPDERRRAGFITLHIVNATMPQRSDRLIISVQLVRDVLAIVSERYATTLDDTSLPYERFVRHLQFSHSGRLTPRPGRSMATRCSVSMKRRIRGRSRVRSQLPTT